MVALLFAAKQSVNFASLLGLVYVCPCHVPSHTEALNPARTVTTVPINALYFSQGSATSRPPLALHFLPTRTIMPAVATFESLES